MEVSSASRSGLFIPTPLDMLLGGPQSRYGRSGEETNPISAPVGDWTPAVKPVA